MTSNKMTMVFHRDKLLREIIEMKENKIKTMDLLNNHLDFMYKLFEIQVIVLAEFIGIKYSKFSKVKPQIVNYYMEKYYITTNAKHGYNLRKRKIKETNEEPKEEPNENKKEDEEDEYDEDIEEVEYNEDDEEYWFNTIKYKNINKELVNQDDCPICYNNSSNTKLNCCHTFCNECIINTICMFPKGYSVCPICRNKIKVVKKFNKKIQ
jgi:hypothetical protein